MKKENMEKFKVKDMVKDVKLLNKYYFLVSSTVIILAITIAFGNLFMRIAPYPLDILISFPFYIMFSWFLNIVLINYFKMKKLLVGYMYENRKRSD